MVARLQRETESVCVLGREWLVEMLSPLQAVFLFLHVKHAAPMRRRFG